jgi:hypothetical protein
MGYPSLQASDGYTRSWFQNQNFDDFDADTGLMTFAGDGSESLANSEALLAPGTTADNKHYVHGLPIPGKDVARHIIIDAFIRLEANLSNRGFFIGICKTADVANLELTGVTVGGTVGVDDSYGVAKFEGADELYIVGQGAAANTQKTDKVLVASTQYRFHIECVQYAGGVMDVAAFLGTPGAGAPRSLYPETPNAVGFVPPVHLKNITMESADQDFITVALTQTGTTATASMSVDYLGRIYSRV